MTTSSRYDPKLSGLPAIILLLTFLLPPLVHGEVRDVYEHFFNESFGDFLEELQNARDEEKLGVMLMFMESDCPYCHRMRNTVLNQAKVQDYFRENFLIFEVNINGDIEVTDFAGKQMKEKDFALLGNRVRATPVFAFYDLDGRAIARYTGATTSIDEFMMLGEYVVEGGYREMSFNRYKRTEGKRKEQ